MYNAKDSIVCKLSELALGNQGFTRRQLVGKLQAIWDCLPDIPEPADIGSNIVQDPWLTYPYDKNLISGIISLFEDSGWSIAWRVRENEVEANTMKSNPRICFSHPSHNLNVVCEFNDSLVGSTCTRKVIGKQTVEKDIVEFVCNEDNSG
mgnify:CR=1 FL=1